MTLKIKEQNRTIFEICFDIIGDVSLDDVEVLCRKNLYYKVQYFLNHKKIRAELVPIQLKRYDTKTLKIVFNGFYENKCDYAIIESVTDGNKTVCVLEHEIRYSFK